MEKAKAKIDSWEPSEDHDKFRYPKSKKKNFFSEKELTPKLIKALKDGLGDSIPSDK